MSTIGLHSPTLNSKNVLRAKRDLERRGEISAHDGMVVKPSGEDPICRRRLAAIVRL